MVEIVQRVVNEKLQLGNDAQLVAHAFAEFKAQGAGVGVDVLQNLFGALGGEDAQIATGNAEIGADAHSTDGDQHAAEGLSFFLKHVAQFFLNETRDFLLSGCFHIYKGI